MNTKHEIIAYLILTSISFLIYASAIVAILHFSLHVTIGQIITYLWQAFLVDLVLAFVVIRIIGYKLLKKLKLVWGYQV